MKSFYAARAVNGEVSERVDMKLPTGFHHDCFITEKYFVIIDGSMRFDAKGVVKGGPLWQFRPKAHLRFGVFPRSEKMTAENLTWIDAPVAAEIVHTMYSYDEGGKIILWAPLSSYDRGKQSGILGGNGAITMARWVIDLDNKSVEIQKVDGSDKYETEFPRIRDDRVGLRTKYGFSALHPAGIDVPDFKFTGLLKWDFEECRLIGEVHYPENVIGGEAVFIPKTTGSSTNGDDDGYIGVFLWHTERQESTWALYDAKSFSATPVAELLVPRRVPLGFHAAYITEEQFQNQLREP